MSDSDCSTFSLTLSNIVSDISNSSVSSFYSSSCSSSSSSSCPSTSCSVSSTCPTSSSSCSYSCPSSSSNCSSSSSKSCVKCLSTACQCKIVQKKYDCVKEKISFHKQCLVVLNFLNVQVKNIAQLLRCRNLVLDRLENIKLIEDAIDRLFCVVSNNTYKCIVVTVCKVKSDDFLNYQQYILKIAHNENKSLKFETKFTMNKINLQLITNKSVVNCFVQTFIGLLQTIRELESYSASVYL